MAALIMVMAVAFAPQAHAFKMTMDDMSTPGIDFIVGDNTAGDIDPSVGVIVFGGPVGSFTVNITTGISKPWIGGTNDARIHLNSVNVSGAAGTLEIMLTDTDFAPVGYQDTKGVILTNQWGGISGGSLTAQGYVDPFNNEFGTWATTGPQGPMGPGIFADTVWTQTAAFPVFAPFSLTERVTITHSSAGMISSFDKELSATPVPEPETMLLLGVGLIALAEFGRRKQSFYLCSRKEDSLV